MNKSDEILALWKKFLTKEPKERVQALIDKIDAMDSVSPTVGEYCESLSRQYNNAYRFINKGIYK